MTRPWFAADYFVRGNDLVSKINVSGENDTHYYYIQNGHGDVARMMDTSGNMVNSYVYDPYGVVMSQTEGTYNPFKYAGELQNMPDNLIYLRNRIYDPKIGRFLTEDPIKDGTNWYVYCNNNPVNYWDPSGLFDYNTRLSYSQTYNLDVVALQYALSNSGYLDMSSGGWGYYGPKTQTAVNSYKATMGINNTGANYGVVDLQTWESLGLIYRTQADIDAGVEIAYGKIPMFDVTKAVTNAVKNAEPEFLANQGEYGWFKNTVGDYGKWNIKRNAKVWAKTLGISENSYGTRMLFYGRVVTVEELGNITYGYLGKVAKFSNVMLMTGSFLNHVKNHYLSDFDNEAKDREYINLGIVWYNGGDVQVRIGAK